MSTTTQQRVGIWVIAIALTVGTIMGFVAMILSSQDQQNSQEVVRKYQEEATAYQKKITDQKAKFEARAKELSDKYYAEFNEQKSQVAPFDAASVKTLQVETVKDGEGEVISDTTAYAAYYIGFTPDGNIFDGSIEGEALKAPLLVQPGQVIPGWSEGMKGKKIGGIYKLQIPSEKAYGAAGSGDKNKPNTPLTFVVMPIEKIEHFKAPQITQEVIKAYGQQQQQ
jgi:FKBP-type peptidyl-prolyl cis-trans isomerase